MDVIRLKYLSYCVITRRIDKPASSVFPQLPIKESRRSHDLPRTLTWGLFHYETTSTVVVLLHLVLAISYSTKLNVTRTNA